MKNKCKKCNARWQWNTHLIPGRSRWIVVSSTRSTELVPEDLELILNPQVIGADAEVHRSQGNPTEEG